MCRIKCAKKEIWGWYKLSHLSKCNYRKRIFMLPYRSFSIFLFFLASEQRNEMKNKKNYTAIHIKIIFFMKYEQLLLRLNIFFSCYIRNCASSISHSFFLPSLVCHIANNKCQNYTKLKFNFSVWMLFKFLSIMLNFLWEI